MNPIKINSNTIGSGNPVYIVAEMSANHNQDFDTAVKLVVEAAYAGADAIKVQTYTPDTMTIRCDRKEFKHEAGSAWDDYTLYDLYSKAYMPWEWQPKLKDVAESMGLDFFSTPFDKTAVDFLETLDVPAYKIASYELVDIPLLKYVAQTGKPVILSTGMAVTREISRAVAALYDAGCDQIILLKCTSAYPAQYSDMNLLAIPYLKTFFHGHPVGLSDHSVGTLAATTATALGADVVEKHLAVHGGFDDAFSLNPSEFKAMVSAIRSTEQIMGSASKGETLTERNVRSIRPGLGLHPADFDIIIGRIAATDIVKGTPLSWDLVEK
jgi:pseudaminic acid synthase